MSPDRLKEWGLCAGKELVLLTRLCCGRWVGNVAEHVTWRDSGSCLSCARCLLPVSCSMFCFLVFWTPQYPEPACTGLCQGSTPDSSSWGRSRALPSIPTALPASPPTSCSHLPAPLWPRQGEGFSLDAFQAGHYLSACLICICHPCCTEWLHFLS